MGAPRRTGVGKWQLSRTPNCASKFVARGVCRIASEPVIWPHILVESAVPKAFGRGRYGTNARHALAERAMDRCLHLQGRAGRHGGGARLGLSAPVYYSVAEGNHCAARFRRKIFRCALLAPGTWPRGLTW